MSRRIVIAAVGCFVLMSGFVVTSGAALAAGPEDGTWDAQCTSDGRCRGDLQMSVTDSQATGEFTAVGYEAPVKGSIGADGTFSGILVGKSGNMKLSGKFSGSTATIVLPYSTCGIPITCPLTRK
jgi:hypothetical protein